MEKTPNTRNQMSKIFETSQYDKFQFVPENRSVRNLTKIRNSMRKYGFIVSFPICVKQVDSGKLMVLDGQHRLEAAKSLGIPVHYVIHNGSAFNISEVNNTQSKWTPMDYLTSHIGSNPEYAKVKAFMDTYHVTLSVAIGLLNGSSASGNATGMDSFRLGTFKCKDEIRAHKTMGLISRVSDVCPFYKTLKFVEAVSRCSLVQEFDHNRFVHSMHNYAYKIKLQPDVDRFIEMIDDIYNTNAKRPIPLKFLAVQAAKERHRLQAVEGSAAYYRSIEMESK
jgi:hypothetical protein